MHTKCNCYVTPWFSDFPIVFLFILKNFHRNRRQIKAYKYIKLLLLSLYSFLGELVQAVWLNDFIPGFLKRQHCSLCTTQECSCITTSVEVLLQRLAGLSPRARVGADDFDVCEWCGVVLLHRDLQRNERTTQSCRCENCVTMTYSCSRKENLKEIDPSTLL